jgi:hypothetical protein
MRRYLSISIAVVLLFTCQITPQATAPKLNAAWVKILVFPEDKEEGSSILSRDTL